MAGNYEDILKIPVDDTEVISTTAKIEDMDKKIAEASKKSTQGFVEFNSSVAKSNNSLKETNVLIDKMFNKIKLSKLSGGFAGFGETAGEVGREIAGIGGLGGLVSGGLVAVIAGILTKAFNIAENSVFSSTKAMRYGMSPAKAQALEFAGEYVGMSKTALLSSAYGLQTRLRDVSSGSALAVLGSNLSREKLLKMDTSQALLSILSEVSKNPLAKDAATQKLLLSASGSLGISEEAMLDAMNSPERLAELMEAVKLGEQEYRKVDYAAQRKLGQATMRTKAGFGIMGGQGTSLLSTVIVKLAPGLQGQLEKNSAATNTIIKQSQ